MITDLFSFILFIIFFCAKSAGVVPVVTVVMLKWYILSTASHKITVSVFSANRKFLCGFLASARRLWQQLTAIITKNTDRISSCLVNGFCCCLLMPVMVMKQTYTICYAANCVSGRPGCVYLIESVRHRAFLVWHVQGSHVTSV